MSIAKIATGTFLKIGDGGSPIETFTTVPEVHKLGGPSVHFDLVDVTSHDVTDNFRQFLAGLADGDNIMAEIHWRPSNAIHQELRDANEQQILTNFIIVFPDTSQNTVLIAGYVNNISRKADVGDALRKTVTIKVVGAPVWS